MRSSLALASLSAALALALALACTADDGGGSGSSSTAATATSAASASASSTSGASGTSASSGSASGTGTTGGGGGACSVDAECKLVDDCCSCESIPAGDEPATCEIDCDQSECSAQGLAGSAAACRSGRCELASTVDCASPVTCNQPAPECAGDMVPSIVAGCYGPCVPYHYCSDTTACLKGCGEGWTCVESQSGGGGGCLPLPQACEGTATCECVAPYWESVCPAGCGASGGGLLCLDGG